VVGSDWIPNGPFFLQLAFRWDSGIFQDLGALNPNAPEAQGLAVSADGSKVVGWSRAVSGYQRPFRWTAATGMKELSKIPCSDAIATGHLARWHYRGRLFPGLERVPRVPVERE
jgi:probable HAF family extracellular repeat protein